MSSEERWRLRILHIKDNVRKIHDYTAGYDFDKFGHDLKTIDAVIRCFQVMGEAARKVPDHIRARFPDVPWKKIAQFRDIVVHDYDAINIGLMWKIIQENLPAVKNELDKIPVSEKDL